MNKMFPDLWCVFEKIVVQRIVYFFIYNVSCAVAEVFRKDDEKQIIEISQCSKNQIEIQDMTKLLYKKKMKYEFERKPFGGKSKFLIEAKQKMMDALAVETSALQNEITPEQA